MKTLQVPKWEDACQETITDKIGRLQQSGARAAINQVNWAEDFPKQLPVTVRVAHGGDRLYLLYEVTGESVRAENTRDFGSVWQDSCVEFFMQREGEAGYRNFECNVLGVLLSRHHKTREDAVSQSQHMPTISVWNHNIVTRMKTSQRLVHVPKNRKSSAFETGESLDGQHSAIYKCGDNTPEPIS